ncbi:MAG: Glucosamine--fructose-6-phosphate aminotransferase [isomerizing] [Candidatus Ozemobacter sibiricus]|uniref:glutamine--fructose-6-phosphate transaminase (isomerizing) n=1 Tax=Candidatus Ozemobacter sibiricus TaxID=2268124 RepID=A0A367ZJ59_9BACT|nr:MAG: Glucosamine--fructose-6-phosphate aminotransferase [isomerizing] [Candidatus Ozemobacter sibiricus]
MCGVIGLTYEHDKSDLGQVASRLLRMLEYRGYDSTGAIVQDSHGTITLRKDVGSPTELTARLGIDRLTGRTFCGQVRWATFGVVSQANAQPHEMRCKTHLYGAHNGNITNCLPLKEWLIAEGHDVKSDNDGEMLVHTVEHFFALELQYQEANDPAVRERALRQAVLKMARRVVGSYAAIVVDPVTELVVAIKAGSSLYVGQGHDPVGGAFVVASSDLASVLQITRLLIPMREKEFAVFTPTRFAKYDLKTGKKLRHACQRSLLRVEETRLQPPYKFFMEQEIHHQVQTARRLISLFTGGRPLTRLLRRHEHEQGTLYARLKDDIRQLAEITVPVDLAERVAVFLRSPAIAQLRRLVAATAEERAGETGPAEGTGAATDLGTGEGEARLESSYASFLEEMRDLAAPSDPSLVLLLPYLDAIFELEDVHEIEHRVKRFVDLVVKAHQNGNAIYILACGTSYHAGKTAPLFFNEIAGLALIPLLPGEFRAQCTNALRDGDVVIGISQSGETKDLIDVFNFIIASRRKVARICLLNNTNSTLALEKSDLFVPLFCGPEIAVPATKSFMNQLLLLYILALRVAERLARRGRSSGRAGAQPPVLDQLPRHERNLYKIPDLIARTLDTTRKETDELASFLHLQPSLHILATRLLGIAKEGALKIRETVLNHTEGFEASEFKHGPNTILGINTIFGLENLRSVLATFGAAMQMAVDSLEGRRLDARGLHRLFQAVADYAFRDQPPRFLEAHEQALFERIFREHNFFRSMYANYPLLFLTGPDETDIHLTISQVNTHKIRGAHVFIIAEDHDLLRAAAAAAPANGFPYHHGYVTLPRTDERLLPVFSITVVLQVLALKMSQRKMEVLDRLEIAEHGVHPDVPKNVSKSITVD